MNITEFKKALKDNGIPFKDIVSGRRHAIRVGNELILFRNTAYITPCTSKFPNGTGIFRTSCVQTALKDLELADLKPLFRLYKKAVRKGETII